jgi:hypothetical protein
MDWLLASPMAPERAKQAMRAFSDELGDRRPIDPLLLAHITGIEPPDDLLNASRGYVVTDPALAVWLAVGQLSSPVAIDLNATGPLFPQLRDVAIETWTEAELSGLHALSLAGTGTAARVRSASDWLMAELQPDNGTNRPWAAHVFLDRWIRERHNESRLYAETLVHNCRVTLGRPDRLSAIILASAAKALTNA